MLLLNIEVVPKTLILVFIVAQWYKIEPPIDLRSVLDIDPVLILSRGLDKNVLSVPLNTYYIHDIKAGSL